MSKRTIVFLSGCVVLAWLLIGILPIVIGKQIEESAHIGDSFGAASSLFSGLAFLGLIISLFLQRNEISLQRQELSLTRGVLAEQAESQRRAMESQAQQCELLERAARVSLLSALIESADQRVRSRFSTVEDQCEFSLKHRKYIKEAESMLEDTA